ncbi:hypothetical protein [Bacillus infantis]|uniref:Uncharacterized protein n=1 Tax=Bacillus infantis TaxID=324767 RepID=A0A5D4R8A9_9BACI|nr:hypothetical protein [Bacillus infantis]TYS46759.1 hypothetical protein FZD51_14905 [Bacillus infantis]
MEFVIGLLSGVVFFILLGVVFINGYKMGIKRKPDPIAKPTDEEIRRNESLQKSFEKLMNYDVTTAYKRKKV